MVKSGGHLSDGCVAILLVSKAHRLLYHATLGFRVIQKKEKGVAILRVNVAVLANYVWAGLQQMPHLVCPYRLLTRSLLFDLFFFSIGSRKHQEVQCAHVWGSNVPGGHH